MILWIAAVINNNRLVPKVLNTMLSDSNLKALKCFSSLPKLKLHTNAVIQYHASLVSHISQRQREIVCARYFLVEIRNVN